MGKRVVVFGAGAVGCAFASFFERAGHETFLIARGSSLEKIASEGITVIFNGEKTVSRPKVFASAEGIGKADLLIISTKAFDLEGACELSKTLVGEETVVLCFQNGIGNEERAERILGVRPVNSLVRGGFSRDSPGTILMSWPGRVEFGEREGGNGTSRIRFLSEMFASAKVQFVVQEDIRKAQWKKFLWNVGFNQVCALTGKACGETVSNPRTRELVKSLALEAVQVGKALGIRLDAADAESILSLPPGFEKFKPSMLQDREGKRRMEAESFGGYVSESGKALGIRTPANDALFALLSAL